MMLVEVADALGDIFIYCVGTHTGALECKLQNREEVFEEIQREVI